MTDITMIRQRLEDCVKRILQGCPDAWPELEQLSKVDSRISQIFFENIIVKDILQPEDVKISEVPKLLQWSSQFITSTPYDSEAIAKAVLNFIIEAKFQDVSELAELLKVLYCPSFLPLNEDDEKLFNVRRKCSYFREFCTALVRTLACFKLSTDNLTRVRQIIPDVEKFLCYLIEHVDENYQLMMVCLKTLYNIISDPNQNQGPGLALMVLKMVGEPKQFFMDNFVAEEHSDAHLAKALQVLGTNLMYWPGYQLNSWIIQLIEGFEARQNYDILNDFAMEVLPKILFSLKLPVMSKECAQVIFYVLKRQATPAVFNKLQNGIIELYEILNNNESNAECLQELVDIVAALTYRFPNNDVLEQIKLPPVPPRQHDVNRILNEDTWTDEVNDITDYQSHSLSIDGKVGLNNLGNTCYMNSVLQALVMTRQFCHEVLNYSPPSEAGDNSVLKKLQNLFTLLTYSKKKSFSPSEILQACRPAYFIAGQQQDSSEFLCHLLDVLHEQEKSAHMQNASSDPMIAPQLKIEEKDCDITATSTECEPMESVSNIKRWTTEENLSEGAVLQRKTQSLADFTNGEELSQTQNLSDSHSNSTDSGIQSVGGEDTGYISLVHRVFGGQSNITYMCEQCSTSSHNTDKFRDLQLCFPEEISENDEVSVQDLINYYLKMEHLTGDNKYRCDKCTMLCDAQRSIEILQAPSHLILTLKHFRYDSESRLRTKLRHKVTYNETIQLKVCASSGGIVEQYHLYGAVVHSGYSMDYGHYFTCARDSKNNWYKFNDSYVSRTTIDDFKKLEPPDTPYILFYGKAGCIDTLCDEDKPELESLSNSVQDLVKEDIEDSTPKLDKKRRAKKPCFMETHGLAP